MNTKLPLLAAATAILLTQLAFTNTSGKYYEDKAEPMVDGVGTIMDDDHPNESYSEMDYGTKDKMANTAKDVEGTTVHGPSGETIGDIDRIVQNEQGEKIAVIGLGLSGSLKEVAIPLNELSWQQENSATSDTLVVDATVAEVEMKEDVDFTDFETLEPSEYSKQEFSRFEEKKSDMQ